MSKLGFTTDSSSSVFIFTRQLPSKLAERNSTKTGHMVGSKCSLKMHVRNQQYPFPQKSRPETSFSISQFNSKFNGLYPRNKKRYT